MTDRQWLDSVKAEHKDHRTSEFYYGEKGTNGLIVFEGKDMVKMICRNENGEVLTIKKGD